MRSSLMPARPLLTTAAALACASALLAACAQTAPPVVAARPAPQGAAGLLPVPPSLPGYRRHVIELPPQPDEAGRQIELAGGKTTEVDCNRHGLDGGFEQRSAPGTGQAYWVLQSSGHVFATKMGCPASSRRTAFVRAGTPVRAPYSSRQPLVIFAPEGMQVQWREAGRQGDWQPAALR
ncbi:MAG: ecotin family protein [Comamonadaceae bacterium]|nr:ecotin family protein [Comamonadaceae bacterium]